MFLSFVLGASYFVGVAKKPFQSKMLVAHHEQSTKLKSPSTYFLATTFDESFTRPQSYWTGQDSNLHLPCTPISIRQVVNRK